MAEPSACSQSVKQPVEAQSRTRTSSGLAEQRKGKTGRLDSHLHRAENGAAHCQPAGPCGITDQRRGGSARDRGTKEMHWVTVTEMRDVVAADRQRCAGSTTGSSRFHPASLSSPFYSPSPTRLCLDWADRHAQQSQFPAHPSLSHLCPLVSRAALVYGSRLILQDSQTTP